MVDIVLAEGWTFFWQLEDLLLITDSRIHGRYLEALASNFGIPARYICRKPRYLNADSAIHEGIAAADAAALLIRLEELGFDTSPQRLVQGVLATLSSARYLTESELLVMEYERQKDRSHLVLLSDADGGDGEWRTLKIKDSVGRRLEFTRVGGRAYRLEVRGPRYRSAPTRKTVTCEYCGYRYTKGDPESALAHRSEHARIRRLLDPKPLSKFAVRDTRGLVGEQVDAFAPKWMHQAIYERAFQFKRELGFDFIQWEGSRERKNVASASCGYLFRDDTCAHPPGTAVGACAFWRDDNGWRLLWVWVSPKMRRAGILARRWPLFLQLYGDFEVESPISKEMGAFLAKHGSLPQQAAFRGSADAEIQDLL